MLDSRHIILVDSELIPFGELDRRQQCFKAQNWHHASVRNRQVRTKNVILDKTDIRQSKHFQVYERKSKEASLSHSGGWRLKSPGRVEARLKLIDKMSSLLMDGTTVIRSRSPMEGSCLHSMDTLRLKKTVKSPCLMILVVSFHESLKGSLFTSRKS